MKKVIVIAIVFAAYVAASPYLTAYQLFTSAENKDAEALAENIEFPILRENVKSQLNASLSQQLASAGNDNPFAAMGAAFGSVVVNSMVDAFITPEAIGRMLDTNEGQQAKSPEQQEAQKAEFRETFKDAKLAYAAWDTFHITLHEGTAEQGIFVLSRRNLDWKLTNIIMNF